MMNKRLQATKYLLGDFFSAALAWVCFFIFRKKVIETAKYGYEVEITLDEKFFMNM